MQLKVSYPVLKQPGIEGVRDRTVQSFADIVSIGADVARSVRVWLRGVPMVRNESRLTIQVHAGWVDADQQPAKRGFDAAPLAPKRKRKAKK